MPSRGHRRVLAASKACLWLMPLYDDRATCSAGRVEGLLQPTAASRKGAVATPEEEPTRLVAATRLAALASSVAD